MIVCDLQVLYAPVAGSRICLVSVCSEHAKEIAHSVQNATCHDKSILDEEITFRRIMLEVSGLNDKMPNLMG